MSQALLLRTENSAGNKKARSPHSEVTFQWNKQTKNIVSSRDVCFEGTKQIKGRKECRGGLFWIEMCLGGDI